ncbi:MAG: hypothetical protein Q4A32_09485 [Lachnospiraceae bacterium]|nr:hypothetical protein [Lachnospiraceae bacterium]
MREDIFRKKSLDRIQSPEQIDDYVRVITPGLWLVLGAVILLLSAFIMWGVMFKVSVDVAQDDGTVVTEEVAPISFVFDEGL